MKNFRKVLALVLVVATLFSFVAMTASAKEYTDADKVSYTEAVDVLTAIGILNGYTDGTYRPTNTIARAEMAKMIAVLANAGKDNIGDLYASACKFADMTGDAVWAKSYVAYCNQIGIVAGRNATTFDPYGKVTGVETAKMLLCMIGFDAKAQGYVGTNWQVNVMRDAEKLGLLDGFSADYKIEKAITREEAAQMMLNALKAPMVVGTVSDSLVKISNAVWIGLVDLPNKTVTITLTDAVNKYNCYVLYGNVLVSNVPVWTNYAGLKVNADARDCYGNPVTKWSYTNAYGKETWSAEYAQTPDYYYTDTTTLKADLDKLGTVGKVEYWYDGTKYSTNLANAISQADGTDSGRGVEVKVYIQTNITPATDATKPATISNDVIVTVKNTYIGQVASINKAAGTFTVNGNPFNNAGYGFKAGDVILYWLCDANHDENGGNELHAAEIATPVNVDVTRTYVASNNNMHDSYVVGSGKTYNYAKNIGKFVSGSLNATAIAVAQNQLDDHTFNLYLDKFGNIMAWTDVEPTVETGYAYLVEGTGFSTVAGTDDKGNTVYNSTANLVDFSATLTEKDKVSRYTYAVMLEAMTGKSISAAHGEDWSNVGHGLLVKYEVVGGEKNVTAVATQGAVDTYLSKDGNLYNGTTLVANGDSETQYLVRTWNYAEGKYQYKAYTAATLDNNYCGALSATTEEDAVKANIQYFTKTIAGNTVATYVFVDALYSNATTTRAFVLNETALISDDLFDEIIGDYTAYDAIIGGKKAILAVNDSTEFSTYNGNYLYEAKLTVIGLVDGDVPVYADLDHVTPTRLEANNTGWWYENGKVWLYDNANKLPGLTPAEGFFAVIAYEKADHSFDVKIETDPVKINDYVEDNFNFSLVGGYDAATSWAVYSGTTISELYLVVTR